MADTYLVEGCTADRAHEWAVMVGNGFLHRPGRPERFWEKYILDPSSDPMGLRVAIETTTNRIVSSTRVFERRVCIDDPVGRLHSLRLAGVGEVATLPDHRRRGLATLLLTDAIRFMGRSGFLLSSLHAAKAAQPLYESLGYAEVSVPYGAVKVTLSDELLAHGHAHDRLRPDLWPAGLFDTPAATTDPAAPPPPPTPMPPNAWDHFDPDERWKTGDSKWTVRRVRLRPNRLAPSPSAEAEARAGKKGVFAAADAPRNATADGEGRGEDEDDDFHILNFMHGWYRHYLRTSGVLLRDEGYWRGFLRWSQPDGLWIATSSWPATETPDGAGAGGGGGGAGGGGRGGGAVPATGSTAERERVWGYIGISCKQDEIRVSEYGTSIDGCGSPTLFLDLLRRALAGNARVRAIAAASGGTVTVRCPLVVLRSIAGYEDAPAVPEYTDLGWMYRDIEAADAYLPADASEPSATGAPKREPGPLTKAILRSGDVGRHLVWFSDSF